MNTLSFTIKAKTVESYLYGGYLFLLMEDGRILYVSYHRLIHMLCDRYPRYSRLIRLAFLHNEYFKSQAAQLILGIEEIKDSIHNLWSRASQELTLDIDFEEIEEYCYLIGEWKSVPLDMYMYDLRMYIASRDGVFESRLNPDFNNKYYPLYPSHLEKCFDQKVISLSARAGKVVLSADKEGLFYGNALVEDKRVRIEDKNHIPGRSLRTGWCDFDLINYASASNFNYLQNKTANIENPSNDRFRFGDKIERKEIVDFATSSYSMRKMMEKASVKQEDVRYCFNSKGRSFFVLDDGSFVNIKIKKIDDEVIQYSSVARPLPSISETVKPLKAAIVPNGCVVEFFEKVVLYQDGEAFILEDSPSYNIRTYMGSRNYRNMVTVTKQDSVSFHSVDIMDTISSARVFS